MTTTNARGNAERLAIASPMIGLVALWCAVLATNLWNLYNNMNGTRTLNWSLYGVLVGIMCLGAGSLVGRRYAAKAGETRLAKSANGFGTVAVIVSLILGAVFGFGTFMVSFGSTNSNGQPISLLERMINVYIPIILDAGFLVGLILFAFVLNHKGDSDD